MVQLPIALAVEPRLLPYAEANGFRMDTKVIVVTLTTQMMLSAKISIATSFSAKCLKNRLLTLQIGRMTLFVMFGN